METLVFFAVMLYISALASVYEEDLLISAYVDVSGGVVSKLIPGHLPFLRGKNPPENRKRFTVIGIVLYSVSALCIAFCVYTALTLEPVEGLVYVGINSRGYGNESNSTEYLVSCVSICCMLFEAAIFLINSIRVILRKPNVTIRKILTGFIFVLLILACLAAGAFLVYCVSSVWQDIKNAGAV